MTSRFSDDPKGFKLEPSQGDGWKITTPHGYIDYRHRDDEDGGVNEIWWVESHKRGHGSELVDLMQRQHPAASVAWGVTSAEGESLRKRWHRKHPGIQSITGAFEGQFEPFGHDEPEDDEDFGDDE
jgi:hypothetical protein